MNLTITKIDAARRQLHTAIELWFNDGDPVSINTLASASHQIIHDLNHNEGLAPLILDRPEFTKEQRKLFANLVKLDSNFFKHADRGKGAEAKSIEFNTIVNEMFISIATQGLKQMGYKYTSYELAFCIWEAIHHPEVLTDETIELLKVYIAEESIKSLKKIRREEFLSFAIPRLSNAIA